MVTKYQQSLWTFRKPLIVCGTLDSCTSWGHWASYPTVYLGYQAFWQTEQLRSASARVYHHNIPSLLEFPKAPTWDRFLFLVFINDLPDHVNIPTELYADDALLHHTFKRSTTALSVRGELQTAVLAAEQWALQWHGRFGHTKTKQLNIGQRQNLSLATVIEDHQIEEVVRHKHLGRSESRLLQI